MCFHNRYFNVYPICWFFVFGQDLGQPKLEDDLPKGLLSVSLLKHQVSLLAGLFSYSICFVYNNLLRDIYVIDVSKKIALAWMVQKEKSVYCAGGILADDQVSFDALSSQQYFSCFTLFLESFLGSFKST